MHKLYFLTNLVLTSILIYIFLLIEVTTLNLEDMIFSIILFLFLIILLNISFKLIKLKWSFKVKFPFVLKVNPHIIIFYSTISILISLILINFYTGQTPMELYENLISGRSTYITYQVYFQENNLGIPSFNKLPYIFLLFTQKFFVFFGPFVLLKSKINFKVSLSMIMVLFTSYFLFGLGRGTSYETFELIILSLFLFFYFNRRINFISLTIFGFLFFVIGFGTFYFNLISRNATGIFENFYISRDVFLDQSSLIFNFSPMLAIIITSLYSYFGYGFYYINTYFNYVVFQSTETLLTSIAPFWPTYLSIDPVSIIRNNIDIGFRWHPDITRYISSFGLFLTFIFVVCIVQVYVFLLKTKSPPIEGIFLAYLIFVQILSLFIGNLLFISSANTLITLLFVGFSSISLMGLRIHVK